MCFVIVLKLGEKGLIGLRGRDGLNGPPGPQGEKGGRGLDAPPPLTAPKGHPGLPGRFIDDFNKSAL